MKMCTTCGESKPLDEFTKKHGKPTAVCRPCAVERTRQWRTANPDRARAANSDGMRRRRQDPEYRAREYAQYNARARKRSKVGEVREIECARCEEVFEFVVGMGPRRKVCDLCRKHDSAWTAFRLTGKQAEELRARGRCDICGGTRPGGRFNEWHIDHDHETGVVRGVLCAACNTAIGLLGESPERIIAAAEYVASHQRTAAS